MTLAKQLSPETQEYNMARMGRADRWVPACGGSEVPYIDRLGRKILYVYNHATGKHGYLDMGTDIVHNHLSDLDRP